MRQQRTTMTDGTGGMGARMRRRFSPSMVVACAALFFSLGGVGVAATGYRITSLWQISPKVRHALVHASTRGSSTRGPQGSPGPAGIPGPQGPQGVPGQDGASNTFDTVKFYYRFGNTQPLTTDQPSRTATAQCDSGDRVINGGFFGQNEIVTTDQLETVIPAEWDVVAHLDPNETSGSVGVWLVCAVRGT